MSRKSSFTPSKLRFSSLRKPKISSCYTTSKQMQSVRKTCWTLFCYLLLKLLEECGTAILQKVEDELEALMTLVVGVGDV